MATYTVESLFRQQPDTNLSECTVSGWVRTVRDSKAFGFIELNDGTHFRNLQVVLERGDKLTVVLEKLREPLERENKIRRERNLFCAERSLADPVQVI